MELFSIRIQRTFQLVSTVGTGGAAILIRFLLPYYTFLWKTHLKPGSCPLSISSSRVSVLYAGALCKREKRAFASGVI